MGNTYISQSATSKQQTTGRKEKDPGVFCVHRLLNAYFCICTVQGGRSVLTLCHLSFLLLSAKTFMPIPHAIKVLADNYIIDLPFCGSAMLKPKSANCL